MKLQVLLSAMNLKSYDYIEKLNIKSDCVVINQCDINNFEIINDKEREIKFISTKERGLSKSRNMALKYATGDICLIADDDLIYVDNYEEIVKSEFEKNPEADIIAFQVEGLNMKFKNYYPKKRKIGYLTSMKISSVEIAFRRTSIINSGMCFNELFGAGAKYYSGEESLFLFECLKKELTIYYIPKKIADLYIGNSSWFKGYDRHYFITKGACFTAMSKKFSLLFILQFAVRKINLYKKSLTIKEAIKFMLEGRRQYLRDVT